MTSAIRGVWSANGSAGRWLMLSALVLLVMAAPAKAGNYALTYGKQFEVCRAFAENLQSFGNLPEGLFEWPLNPKFKAFKRPDWQPLVPTQHAALIERWARMMVLGNQPPGDYVENKVRTMLADIQAGRARLEKTVADVNNDGPPEVLYRIQLPYMVDRKRPSDGMGWEYFIVNETGEVDERSHGFPVWSLLDSFFYKGRLFIDHGPWPYDLGSNIPDLTIAELRQPRPSERFAYIPVCRFNYAPRREQ